ncbi:hypothetical protein BD413DRAFT_490589 [Trametes elegans]|nr:hypothetical protein BD413DRAFT_490589 [Trametes elegans]
MAVKTHSWISIWFAVTLPIIFMDAAYCLLRPRSMRGGDLHWLFKPYGYYQDVDYVYGVRAYENGDGFPNAQCEFFFPSLWQPSSTHLVEPTTLAAALNVVENLMNIAYLYLAHVSGSPLAPLVGFASAMATLWKTALYWLQEYYCGFCAVGHNDLKTLFFSYVCSGGPWIVLPILIIRRLGQDIAAVLRASHEAAQKDASGKQQ